MSLKINNNDIKFILGSSRLSKLYVGNDLILEELTGPLPYMAGIKGVFNYGGLVGNSWINEVGTNNFTWTEGNAPTDNGTEYVLSGNTFNKAGQYESTDEYSGHFTVYLLAKFEDVSAKVGGIAFTIGGYNHGYTYGVTLRADYEGNGKMDVVARDVRSTSASATEFHVIAITFGSGHNSVYAFVDGVKETSPYSPPSLRVPFVPDGNATLYGKLPSTAGNGTMHVKFVAFGNERQTDEQIIANSLFIMRKYNIS